LHFFVDIDLQVRIKRTQNSSFLCTQQHNHATEEYGKSKEAEKEEQLG
jgi:hypothetical protein